MLAVLMFAVGRGSDIFKTFENLFEKTDRQFNNINVNFPATLTTILGTSVLAEVIFNPVCPFLPMNNTIFNGIEAPRNLINLNNSLLMSDYCLFKLFFTSTTILYFVSNKM